MPYTDGELEVLIAMLSEERLADLRNITGNDADAIALHQQTLDLGTALMSVTATIEIALRNTVCANLQQHFGLSNWLLQPPIDFQWRAMERTNITKARNSAIRAKYAKLSTDEKRNLDQLAYPTGRPAGTTHNQRVTARKTHINVSEGSVVAELTMHFWKRLFGPDYDHSLWRPTLKRTFPNRSLARADVATPLETIYQTRNRLAHHEPVVRYRLTKTFEAIDFVATNLGVPEPSDDAPLARLIKDQLTEVVQKAEALHGRLDTYSDC